VVVSGVTPLTHFRHLVSVVVVVVMPISALTGPNDGLAKLLVSVNTLPDLFQDVVFLCQNPQLWQQPYALTT
jgi:hypothetical protein